MKRQKQSTDMSTCGGGGSSSTCSRRSRCSRCSKRRNTMFLKSTYFCIPTKITSFVYDGVGIQYILIFYWKSFSSFSLFSFCKRNRTSFFSFCKKNMIFSFRIWTKIFSLLFLHVSSILSLNCSFSFSFSWKVALLAEQQLWVLDLDLAHLQLRVHHFLLQQSPPLLICRIYRQPSNRIKI